MMYHMTFPQSESVDYEETDLMLRYHICLPLNICPVVMDWLKSRTQTPNLLNLNIDFLF